MMPGRWMEAVKYWIMGGAGVLMLSAPVVLSSAGWWRVDCGPVGSILLFCSLKQIGDSSSNWQKIFGKWGFLLSEPETVILLRWVRSQSNTTESQYLCPGRDLGGWCDIFDVKTHSWRHLYYSVELRGSAVLQYINICSEDTMPTMSVIIHAFQPPSLPENHQCQRCQIRTWRLVLGLGLGENQFYLLMQMTTSWEIFSDERRFHRAKNKSPLSQQKRSN